MHKWKHKELVTEMQLHMFLVMRLEFKLKCTGLLSPTPSSIEYGSQITMLGPEPYII